MINVSNQILLKNINFKINRKFFFNNLSLNISTSGITVILGPNGSGKSLLTKILKGIIKPDSGDLLIRLNNKVPNIGYLSQNITFLRRDVFSNLAYPLKIKGCEKEKIFENINSLLSDFKFSHHKKKSARRLSGGNKQYLSFMRALVTKPKILILDEPSSNLDMDSTKRIENYLLKKKKEIKIIMVTHDLFQAKRLADEILFLNEGKIIEISEKKKFLSSRNKLVRRFLEGNLF
ncbi:MAG: ATP-binding cassette domain-containing protein [Pseudomonadota bacterium]|nr:ATP-binding cassette domain-containing protein [Pseudomonadota bacterium]